MVARLSRVAIIGAGGTLSATVAYVLILSNRPMEILIADVDEDIAQVHALDLRDVSSNCLCSCRRGTLAEAGQCDVAVLCAGYPQHAGESRQDLLNKNGDILKTLIRRMSPLKEDTILLVTGSPVDALTHLTQQYSGLPFNQVIGTGTSLNTNRLRLHLADVLKTNSSSVRALVIGENEGTQFVPWSDATVEGHKLLPRLEKGGQDEALQQVLRKATTVVTGVRVPSYSLGKCVTEIVHSILFREHHVACLSVYHPEFKSYVSWPTRVAAKGAGELLDMDLTEDETRQMRRAAASVQSLLNKTERFLESENISTSAD